MVPEMLGFVAFIFFFPSLFKGCNKSFSNGLSFYELHCKLGEQEKIALLHPTSTLFIELCSNIQSELFLCRFSFGSDYSCSLTIKPLTYSIGSLAEMQMYCENRK